MFLAINLKKYRIGFLCILCCIIISGLIITGVVSANATPKLGFTIVIDAGHGGMDGGTVSADGKVKESDINLEYAKAMKKQLESCGFKVVLTRTSSDGLYSRFGTNYKDEDMQKRKDIILETKPDLVLSMHTNFFTDTSQKGSQVFYQEGDEKSKALAQSVQEQLKSKLGTTRECLSGDFYICKCHPYLSIICECGFLSNTEDLAKITSEEFKQQYCYAVACGIIATLITPNTQISG